MEKTTTDPKNLVLAQQVGIVITAVATLTMAVLKIRGVLQDNSTTEPTE